MCDYFTERVHLYVQFAHCTQVKSTKSKRNHFSSEDLNPTLLSCIAAGYSEGDRISNGCPFIVIMNIYTVVLLCRPLTQRQCAVNLEYFASINKELFNV